MLDLVELPCDRRQRALKPLGDRILVARAVAEQVVRAEFTRFTLLVRCAGSTCANAPSCFACQRLSLAILVPVPVVCFVFFFVHFSRAC